MALRLTITLKTEKRFILQTELPIAHWCEACGSESLFVDEENEASLLSTLPAVSDEAHRIIVKGRRFLCLRSITNEP